MKYVAMLALVPFLMLGGCSFLQISPEQAAALAEKGAAMGTTLGLKALSSDAATCAKVKTYATEAKVVIDTTILPLLSGANVGTVTVATVDLALNLLDGKVDPVLRNVLQTAIDGVLAFVQLPANPADKLSDNQRLVIVAVFKGLSEGIDGFLKWAGPSKAMSKDMQTPVVHLAWKYGGKTMK